jgi:hypothetical protein
LTSLALYVVAPSTSMSWSYVPACVPRYTRYPRTLVLGDALHVRLSSRSAVALKCTAVGGSGGGSMITMLLLAEPLVADTVMLVKIPPAELYSVTVTLPEPLVTPVNVVVRVGNAVDKLPRLPASVVIVNVMLALAAATPPSNAVAVKTVLAPAAMSVALAESATEVCWRTVIDCRTVGPLERVNWM